MVLERIFEANFSQHSPRFRPGCECQSAFKSIRNTWTGMCFLEFDMEKGFDYMDCHRLVNIVKARMEDQRRIDRIPNRRSGRKQESPPMTECLHLLSLWLCKIYGDSLEGGSHYSYHWNLPP
uniref:Reverse transcriptase domain-containing protein n=1 Tax=Anthoceros angustus TaxID=48387 RepID=A0A2P1L4W4_ANTAG|nr:hypothetical protein AnanMp18 [Anthoceros angustus]AVP12847.1 hypothetical protein AnanMp18 [Anthoceros angustus]